MHVFYWPPGGSNSSLAKLVAGLRGGLGCTGWRMVLFAFI